MYPHYIIFIILYSNFKKYVKKIASMAPFEDTIIIYDIPNIKC